MNMVEIINKKRLCKQLTKEELQFTIDGFLDGSIPDYQMSSLLMAICLNGMGEQEIFELTDIMLHSGEIMDLSSIEGIKVDKHSTGGVGDKTTLILGPVVAACGVNVAKMSGRGLGHTGGTIDKLESIPDFSVTIPIEQFKQQVNEIHLAIVSQMGNLVLADKKIYALRDVTGTVESIPLIASSIMSKKLASGADRIVLDVKVGAGALLKDLKTAREFANLVVKIGNQASKKTICVLTNMNQPLGYAIGNALEVQESISFLQGNYIPDLYELIIKLASIMVSLGKNITIEEASSMVQEVLENGKAYEKFLSFVERQHGKIEQFKIEATKIPVMSLEQGYITRIDAYALGECARVIGAGRLSKTDVIDPNVGIVLQKKIGDYVEKGEILAYLYVNDKKISENSILKCFTISNDKPILEPFIYEVIQ